MILIILSVGFFTFLEDLAMEQNAKTPTCEERIDAHLKNRMEEFFPDVSDWSVLQCARLLKNEGGELRTTNLEDLRDEVLETIQNRAVENLLSLERTITFKLCLSWGGPADYFELDWNPEAGEWEGGRYLFQDWYDGATRNISREEAAALGELFNIQTEK
jgi:hypothetical protein